MSLIRKRISPRRPDDGTASSFAEGRKVTNAWEPGVAAFRGLATAHRHARRLAGLSPEVVSAEWASVAKARMPEWCPSRTGESCTPDLHLHKIIC
jgi:hypothetical protein